MCDFRLEDMEGNVLLGKIKERYPQLPVIIITGYSDIKIAVEVMKMGAYDYITKPLFPDEILVTIKKALEAATIQDTGAVHEKLRARDTDKPLVSPNNTDTGSVKAPVLIHSGEYIFGDTPVFRQLLQQIDLVGPTNYSVIIYGESGSGKKPLRRKSINEASASPAHS